MLYEQEEGMPVPQEEAVVEAMPFIATVQRMTPPRNAVAKVEPSLARSRHYAETLGMTEVLQEDEYPALARAVAMASGSGIPHPMDSDYTQIPHRIWEQMFSSRPAITAVKGLMLSLPHRAGNHSMGYKLNEEAQVRLDTAERNYVHTCDGEYRLPTKHKYKTGRGGIRLDRIPNAIPVNLDAVINVRDAINPAVDRLEAGGGIEGLLAVEITEQLIRKAGSTAGVIKSLLNTRRQLNDLLSLASNDGMLPQGFSYTSSSRWQGIDYNLQLTNTLTRKAALAGHYSYDISTAYHSIVLWLGEQADLQLNGLSNYVHNKEAVRNELTALTGASAGTIKAVLIALGYGARDGGWSIRQMLSPQQYQHLRGNPTYRAIADDLNRTFRHVVDTAERSADRRSIKNAQGYLRDVYIGQGRNRRPITDKQISSHICFGWECRALMAIIEAADTSVLPIHDCVVCQTEQDINRLEAAVEEATGGLRIELDQDIYPDFAA